MTYHVLISNIPHYLSSPAISLASLQFLKHFKHMSTSGPSHFLFFQSKRIFTQIAFVLALSLHWNLCSVSPHQRGLSWSPAGTASVTSVLSQAYFSFFLFIITSQCSIIFYYLFVVFVPHPHPRYKVCKIKDFASVHNRIPLLTAVS